MELTKRQEQQLNKVFDNPKKLRKWIDDVHNDMIVECDKRNKDMIDQYLNVYSIAVAYTLRNECGFGKKRLPEIMQKVWSNINSFKEKDFNLDDCIKDLADNGIIFENIENKMNWKEQ